MNKLKLSLQNFQSISEGELVFQTGLNVIVGQSNSGKSATFRALKACLANPSGSQRFIKNGESKSDVLLDYNNNVIEWQRSSKESSYVINGEKYHKTGSSNAFKILNDETGFTRDDNDVIMNIEEELQLPFPFGISKADLFKIFENVFCVSDSAVILKSAKDNEDDVKSDLASLELEKQKNEVKIRELTEFADFINLDKLEQIKNSLVNKRNRLIFLKEGRDEIQLAVILSDKNLAIPLKEFKNLLIDYSNSVNLKKVVKEIKKLHKLSTEIKDLQVDNSNLLVKREELLSLLRTVTNLKKIKTLEKGLNEIQNSSVEFENKLVKLEELKNYKKYIEDLKEKIRVSEENKKREEEKVKDIEAKLHEYKVCPLCHHSLED